MVTEIEYLRFLLSNRIHPEYSLKDIRREIEDRIRELKTNSANSPNKSENKEQFTTQQVQTGSDTIHKENAPKEKS